MDALETMLLPMEHTVIRMYMIGGFMISTRTPGWSMSFGIVLDAEKYDMMLTGIPHTDMGLTKKQKQALRHAKYHDLSVPMKQCKQCKKERRRER